MHLLDAGRWRWGGDPGGPEPASATVASPRRFGHEVFHRGKHSRAFIREFAAAQAAGFGEISFER